MPVINRSVLVRAPVEVTWPVVVDWPRHGDWVPLTTVRVLTPSRRGVGTRFVGRTALPSPAGWLGFDDVMEVVEWREPNGTGPGHCAVVKQGRLVRGRAWFEVVPTGPADCRVSWGEDVDLAPVWLTRRLLRWTGVVARPLVDRVVGAGLGRILARMARDIEREASGTAP